jgi:hypothetical protein
VKDCLEGEKKYSKTSRVKLIILQLAMEILNQIQEINMFQTDLIYLIFIILCEILMLSIIVFFYCAINWISGCLRQCKNSECLEI